MTSETIMKDYARQLSRITHSLAIAQNDAVAGDLVPGQPASRVEMFTSGNLDKRTDKLVDQLEMFENDFDDLPELVDQYIRSVALAAYDTGTSDADRFVCWLPTVVELTPEQRDLTLVIRSRFAVEESGRRQRMNHVRFQELVSLNDRLAPELQTNSSLRIHLNPIRTRTVFETGVLTGEEEVPESGIEVVFFAFQTDVRTVILESDGRAFLQTLADVGPCRLSHLQTQLALTTSIDNDSLLEILIDCSDVGLIAFS